MATLLRKCLRCNLQKNLTRFLPRHRICLDCRPQQPVLHSRQPALSNENFPLNTEHICSNCHQSRPIHLFIGTNNQQLQTCNICRVSIILLLYYMQIFII